MADKLNEFITCMEYVIGGDTVHPEVAKFIAKAGYMLGQVNGSSETARGMTCREFNKRFSQITCSHRFDPFIESGHNVCSKCNFIKGKEY